MLQDDPRFLGRDGAAEDAVLPSLVALFVRPLGELVRGRRVSERDGALPDDEAEHDAQWLARDVHGVSGVPHAARMRQAYALLDSTTPRARLVATQRCRRRGRRPVA